MSDSPQMPSAVETIEIVSLAAGGDGVGRLANGKTVFVGRSAPGDHCSVRVTKDQKRVAFADLVDVITPSKERVPAVCRHFEQGCGGCTWQHVTLAEQLRSKEQIVRHSLKKCITDKTNVLPIVSPAAPLHWRRRAKLHWSRDPKQPAAAIGMHAQKSHDLVAIQECPQLTKPLEAGLQTILRQIAPFLWKQGDIHMLCDEHGQVIVELSEDGETGLQWNTLDLAAPEWAPLVGLTHGNRRLGTTYLPLEFGIITGAPDFAQASAEANAYLVKQVIAMVEPKKPAQVLELFAGAGNFTQQLAKLPSIQSVVAVERETRGGGRLAKVRWHQAPAEQAVQEFAKMRQRFDMIVLDPPRTGAASVMPHIPALTDGPIVYISCDPATLARDGETLMQQGYSLVQVEPIDMMAMTHHVEILCRFEKV